MTDIKLVQTSPGNLDMAIEKGGPVLVTGEDQIRQGLEFKLMFFQNDWFLALDFGVPYFGRVFQRGVNISDLYTVFSTAILEEPGVVRVKQLNIDVNARTRVLNVTGSVLASTSSVIEFSSTPSI